MLCKARLTSPVSSQALRAELAPMHSEVVALANVKPQEMPRVGSSFLEHRHLHPDRHQHPDCPLPSDWVSNWLQGASDSGGFNNYQQRKLKCV